MSKYRNLKGLDANPLENMSNLQIIDRMNVSYHLAKDAEQDGRHGVQSSHMNDYDLYRDELLRRLDDSYRSLETT